MVRLFQYQTPDARLRGISYLRQREEGRRDRLDEQESRRIQGDFQTELQRKAVLDRRDEISAEMKVETDRRADLDERFREVEQRQQPSLGRPAEVPAGFRLPETPLAEGRRASEARRFVREITPEALAPTRPEIADVQSPEVVRRFREQKALDAGAATTRRLIAEGVPEDEALELGQLHTEAILAGRRTFSLGERVTPEGQRALAGDVTDEELEGLITPPDVERARATAERMERGPVAMEQVQRLQTRFADPAAALLVQSFKHDPLEQKLAGVAGQDPRFSVRPMPEGEQFVNPIAAALGSEEEQQRAQGVLEEAGLPASLAARLITDPLNLLPVVGFTKIDDFIRLARLTKRGAGAVRKSPTFQRVLRTAQSEAGGARLGGEGVPLAQFDKARLPPVPEGHTRMFRGESPFPRNIVGESFAAQQRGRWFTTDPDRAARFAAKAKVGEVRYIDVPNAELSNWRNAKEVGVNRPADEFLAPEEFTQAGTLTPRAPLRGRELPGGSIAETSDEAIAHISKGDPGPLPPDQPPPPREPPKGPRGPSPDDPEFRNIQEVALTGEMPEETLIRRHGGAITTEALEAERAVATGNRLLRKAGLGRDFRGTVVERTPGEFDELNSLLHNPNKVASGERIVPDELRPMYDDLRAQTDFEQTARIDFDPDMALVEDYFFRGWKPPEGMFTGEARGPLGRNPAFRLPRVDATYDEMRAAGFEPLFANPYEQQRLSRMMGVKYREQMQLIEDIRANELALPDAGGPVPDGWRVPKVGPAFEGKPYASGDQVAFTRRWVVPDSLANRLENAYGKTPNMGKGTLFGKTVDIQKLVDAVVFLPKRAKLIGSVFQHVDFLNRSHIGAWTGAVDALRRGQPIAAAGHLARWPKTVYTMVRAVTGPGWRQNLRNMALDTTPLFKNRKVSMKMISEAGLSRRDPTIGIDIDDIAREIRQESKLVKGMKAPLRALGELERMWRDGLFKGMYPAAILTDVRNNIAPMMLRAHPDATDAQLAGMIAKAANVNYSVVPGSMSVVQNRVMRSLLTRMFFSMGEQEGLLRFFTGAIRGENAAYFRTRWLGAYVALVGMANVIHLASTGKPLPQDRWSPISKNNWGPLPIGYNRDFAAPNIPLTGRSGTQVTLDLVGQMDTAFRLLDPAGFLSSRESVPIRTAQNQITGTDFFGAPIDTVGPGGVFSRTAQLIQDLFAPIGPGQAGLEVLRSNIEETEGLIQPGESRLGTRGIGVQATGVNLRAETTPQLLDRIRGEVMREKGIEESYEDIKATDSPLANEIDNEVEVRIGQELELRSETAKLRGQQTLQGQGFEAIEATRETQETEQLADDANLNSGQWAGDIWREEFRDRQRDFFRDRERIKQDFQIEFDEKEAPSGSVNAAIDAYFDVNIDDYPQKDGTTDWDGFFKARDAALVGLPSKDKTRVMKFIRKFDTPTVTKFRKAQKVVDRFFETPKYVGLDLDQGKEVDRILFEIVPRLQAAYQRETEMELARGQAIMSAIELTNDPEVARFLLMNFGPRLSVRRRRRRRAVSLEKPSVANPDRDQILIDNQQILAIFYPDLLAQQLSREQEVGLGEEAFEAVQP